MGRVVIVIAVVSLTVYALVSISQAHPERVRLMPRWLWFLICLAAPVAGPVTWLLFGQPSAGGTSRTSDRRPIGPDDDPDFLRKL